MIASRQYRLDSPLRDHPLPRLRPSVFCCPVVCSCVSLVCRGSLALALVGLNRTGQAVGPERRLRAVQHHRHGTRGGDHCRGREDVRARDGRRVRAGGERLDFRAEHEKYPFDFRALGGPIEACRGGVPSALCRGCARQTREVSPTPPCLVLSGSTRLADPRWRLARLPLPLRRQPRRRRQ